MFELKVLDYFSAAHQLKMVSDKCENLHGHNWKVEVCIRGTKLNSAGIILDFALFKKYLKKILAKLDHKFLNDLDIFNKTSSSSENIAFYIALEMQKKLDVLNIFVNKVSVWESENSCASYYCNNI